MRQSKFFGDETDDFGDGNDKRSIESPMSVHSFSSQSFPIIQSPSSMFLKNALPTDRRTDGRTNGRTDGQTDGRTKPHIEIQGRI